MLLGQRSEKFIPDPAATQPAIQQTLGTQFDSTEVEAIIEQTMTSAATTTATSTKTSRRKKHHKAHKGRKPIAPHMETETIVYDLAGDKTGMKPMGNKVTVVYDIVPGKLISEDYSQAQKCPPLNSMVPLIWKSAET